MVEFVCDDKETEKLLRLLCKQVTDNGGIIHDKLTIGCSGGDLKISAPAEIKENTSILVLPKKCLLPHERFKLAVEGDDIVIKSHAESLTQGQVDMMETMMAIYNRTGKIKGMRCGATLSLYYKDPDLLDHILNGREREGFPFLKELGQGDEDTFYLKNFIKTRVLGFKEKLEFPEGEENIEGPKYVRTQVLMPVIDFLNHYPRSPGFMTNFGDENNKNPNAPEIEEAYDDDGVAVVKSCPVAGSDECYVYYGPYDAMDTFLHYNYTEQNAFVARSIPVTVKLPGWGTLKIGSISGKAKHKKLPDQIKDLAFYLPQMIGDKSTNTLSLSFIYIPGEQAPRSLRRVLGAAISQFGATLDERDVFEFVLMAEKQIINENLKFFEELYDELQSYKATPDTEIVIQNARDMARCQLKQIRNYPFFAKTQEDKAADAGSGKKTTKKKAKKKATKKTAKKKRA